MTVSFQDWVSETIDCISENENSTLRCLLRAGYYWYVGGLLLFTRYHPIGTNIFEREWDALIVLDACRVDALYEVADEYGFLSEIEKVTSVGSMTPEWVSHTFTNEYSDEISQTGYILENPLARQALAGKQNTGVDALPIGPLSYDIAGEDSFDYFELTCSAEFASSSEWTIGEGDGERVHPRYTTERAIKAGRSRNMGRLIVHYNYPHEPYPKAEGSLSKPINSLSTKEINSEQVWEDYVNNLRLVLDEVEILLDNLSADNVVITADHGEAFGEYGFYQHIMACPIPCVRQVPWVRTTAKDTGDYSVSAPTPESVSESRTVDEKLQALGYQ
jgi:hypothetical protein